MDVSLLQTVPVGIVLVCAILVFVFGFKKAEQPPFAQLSVNSDVDRKLASKKRSKTREKKAVNGQIVTEKTSPAKKASSVKVEALKKSTSKADEVDSKLKEKKQEDNKPTVAKKEKNQEAKSGKENKIIEQVKNKKNQKNFSQEKPVDFDEGDWEQAYSRKDKKNKKKEEDTPSKKIKKTAKKTDLINEMPINDKDNDQEKPEFKDKVAKETENKELKEKDNKEIVLTPIISDNLESEKIVENITEEKVEAVSEVEKPEKEEKKGKSKKSKKFSESDSTPIAPKLGPKIIDKEVIKKVEEIIVKDVSENMKSEQNVVKATPVFDELGDVWTEAKPQKKSKKKARKDN